MASFFRLYSTFSLLAAAVLAVNPFSSPAEGDVLKTKEAFLVEWTASNNDTVSLYLLQGNSDDLSTVLTIATNLTNSGIVRWTPPEHIYTATDYVLKIEDDVTSDVNYSGFFTIKGLNGTASSTTASSKVTSSVISSSASRSRSSSTAPFQNSTTSSFSSTTTSSSSTSSATATASSSTAGASYSGERLSGFALVISVGLGYLYLII
ncbi:Ser-Thr-rich glycosyl-phosphatidyl-inositol-anchored membrane family-domain-containing protein [Lipomyces oligophaga]|uniref:Ser-Thr-rich glycosyl-phosphatidyl-inositol-anchored membrane family-domain-containing protein n=1 Tax=Lipomyces oligophaga TaxID=45792 RepID=UPI0034CF7757